MAVAGLVMGYGVFLLIPFILILAAIAIPNLLRARVAANESSAVASIRAINTAQRAYKAEFPAIGFACELNHLGGSSESQPSAENARFLDRRLSAGEKTGYRFSVESCVNGETEHKYQIVASPMVRNTTGRRAFCSDESGVVKWGNPAANAWKTERRFSSGKILLAGASAGWFKPVHLRFALRAVVPVGGFAVLLFAGTIIKSRVRIDPYLDRGISLKMNFGCGSLGDAERDQRAVPTAQRRRGWTGRTRRRPQQREYSDKNRCSKINVSATKAQLHTQVAESPNQSPNLGGRGDLGAIDFYSGVHFAGCRGSHSWQFGFSGQR